MFRLNICNLCCWYCLHLAPPTPTLLPQKLPGSGGRLSPANALTLSNWLSGRIDDKLNTALPAAHLLTRLAASVCLLSPGGGFNTPCAQRVMAASLAALKFAEVAAKMTQLQAAGISFAVMPSTAAVAAALHATALIAEDLRVVNYMQLVATLSRQRRQQKQHHLLEASYATAALLAPPALSFAPHQDSLQQLMEYRRQQADVRQGRALPVAAFLACHPATVRTCATVCCCA